MPMRVRRLCRLLPGLCVWTLAVSLASTPGAVAGELDVIIDEIHYNVLREGGDARLEFVEIANLGATRVDLGGWRFTQGIEYEFPAGETIDPGEYRVIGADPLSLATTFGVERPLGPWVGSLDNGGEILELRNARGHVIHRVHYEDGGAWPNRPDGRGPSLELVVEDNGTDLPARWKPSLFLNGTPGARNSRIVEPFVPTPPETETLLPIDAIWQTFPGRSAPSSPLGAWTSPGFDDSAWAPAQGGFGYGDAHGFSFNTFLSDMRGSYSTFHARGRFSLDAARRAAIADGAWRAVLSVTYDDAFIAYVNGVEIARDNVGQAGTPAPPDATADSGRSTTFEIEIPIRMLVTGENFIALHGVNRSAANPDFYLGGSVALVEVVAGNSNEIPSPYLGGIINEVVPGPTGGVELYNPTSDALELGATFLFSSRLDFIYELPPGTRIDPSSFLWISRDALGVDLVEGRATFVLVDTDGRTILDDLVTDPRGGRSFGRFPDGESDDFALDRATPGAANVYTEVKPVVIHEIQFHPEYRAPDADCARRCSDALQWIELFNRSDRAVDLTGWALEGGVSLAFASGLSIASRAHLIVSADPVAFAAAHPGVTATVVGPWTGRLSHSSETLVLRDALGNPVDRVEYGDGGPTNDENSQDGIDDGTFRGSVWPLGADGTGRTLELVHPDLSNRSGLAWAASVVGGTPGAPNSQFNASPAPTIRSVRHDPLVPRSAQDVRVTCRLSSVAALTSAGVRWALDGGGPSGLATLSDDGAGVDEIAGDGLWSARIPAQGDGSIVRYSIEASAAGGASVRIPLEPATRPYGAYPGTFFLYEVDDSTPPARGTPIYRVLMTAADRAQLRARSADSNVLLPATFLAGDELRHVVGLRFRGESSRGATNRSYKIRLAPESALSGLDNVNLNGSNGNTYGTSAFTDQLSSDLFRRSGAPYPQEWNIVLHFADVAADFDTRYIHKETLDDRFLSRFFGGSDEGNLYRARNPNRGNRSGDFSYTGTDVEAYRDLYEKRSFREEDDFSDIIELCAAFSPQETPDEIFASRMEELVDARQWAGFFAIMACVTNSDGGIWNNNGEDFFLYRVPVDSSRPDAGKWLILPWDLEETFTSANENLFRSTVRAIARFFSVPEFARLYYEELLRVRDGAFSRLQMRQRYGSAGLMFDPEDVFNVVDAIDTNVTVRLGYFDENIARSIESGAESDGAGGLPLIDFGASWRFFRGVRAPDGGPNAWTGRTYSDESWELGASGFGYSDGDDATVLVDMQNNYSTVFIRHAFSIADPGTVGRLSLRVDYDDAFVAYLNGEEIARSSNAPGGAVIAFDALADSNHEATGGGGSADTFDVSSAIDRLVAGANVLAVVGLNGTLDSSDFSLISTLSYEPTDSLRGPSGGCGDTLFAEGATTTLSGFCNPTTTRSILVNGVLAAFDIVHDGNGPYGAVWRSDVSLEIGVNPVLVQALDGENGTGATVETRELTVRRVPGAFTIASTDIGSDTVWTAAQGPIRLSQTINVAAGATLTIEPGVVVLASGGASIVVRGRLLAVGTSERPVLFQSYRCASPWGGIAIDRSGTDDASPTSRLAFCDLRGGSGPNGFSGCVAAVGSKILIEDCAFSEITTNAFDASGSRAEIVRSSFRNLREGVHTTNTSTIVLDCDFENMIGNSDCIDFDGSGPTVSRIERCFFNGSSDDGIDLGNVTVEIRDNIIVGIQDKAISMEGPGAQGSPAVTGNLVVDSGTGLAVKNGIRITDGSHNTIVNCQEGLTLFAKDLAANGGHGVFHSMILWGNGVDIFVDDRSTLELTHSDVSVGVWPGEGNISRNPRFVSPASGNFALAPDSPCIGTGRDGSDMGAIPFGGAPVEGSFLRGDTNLSGRVDISDAIATLDYLFQGGEGPDSCLDRVDANDDGATNLTDAIYTLRHLFAGGPPLPPPYPMPGFDPTPDGFVCAP